MLAMVAGIGIGMQAAALFGVKPIPTASGIVIYVAGFILAVGAAIIGPMF